MTEEKFLSLVEESLDEIYYQAVTMTAENSSAEAYKKSLEELSKLAAILSNMAGQE